MKAFVPGKRVFAVGVLSLYFAACTATEIADNDTSSTVVTIVRMQGSPADPTGGAVTDDLFSDVCANDEVGGAPPPGCTAVNDFGIVTMEATQKDILRDAGPSTDVVFERYRVTFERADGRNVPGVDVPFPFDGVANFRVSLGVENMRVFTIVRQQAKLEPPLQNLAFNGGAILISTIARIDFFGRDVAGRPITVTGFLNVTFGDF